MTDEQIKVSDNVEEQDNEILENDEATSNEEPTITEAQLQKRLKRQEKTLEKKYEQSLADYNKKLEDLQDEFKKLKMSEDEIKKFDEDKKQQELDRLASENNYLKMTKVATEQLSESKFPVNDALLDFVIRENEEQTINACNALSDLVDTLVADKLNQSARTGNLNGGKSKVSSSKDSFNPQQYANKNRIVNI